MNVYHAVAIVTVEDRIVINKGKRAVILDVLNVMLYLLIKNAGHLLGVINLDPIINTLMPYILFVLVLWAIQLIQILLYVTLVVHAIQIVVLKAAVDPLISTVLIVTFVPDVTNLVHPASELNITNVQAVIQGTSF